MNSQIVYKIKIYYRVCAFAIIATSSGVSAQELAVTSKAKIYRKQVEGDSLKKMVELRSLAASIEYDLRYASKNNFTKQELYKNGRFTFLRILPAMALKKVQEELGTQGYGLKIFDAYRPYGATKKMWELVQDERYVANPKKGSHHNRGLAVDLTIIELSTGQELDMGTGFDNFSDTAHHNFKFLRTGVIQNRKLLRETMEKYGFRVLETEWWHYSWPNDRNYELLDLGFKKLREVSD